MSTLIDEAIALIKALPEEDQERAANALMAFADERTSYTLSDEQIAGIDHAIAQAARGEFASDRDVARPGRDPMKIRLTADALSDLETFKHAAGLFDVNAAASLMHAITRSLRAIALWPRIGKSGTLDGTYEFVVRRLPFVIVYQLDVGDEDEVIVLRVYHVRQSRS